MKAILVIDIGNNKVEEIRVDELILTHISKDDFFRQYNNYELRPIPEKAKYITPLSDDTRLMAEQLLENNYSFGRNDCINELLGETE